MAQRFSQDYLDSLYAIQQDAQERLGTVNPNDYATDTTVSGNLASGFKQGLAGTVGGLGGFASMLGMDGVGSALTNYEKSVNNGLRPSGYNSANFSMGEVLNPLSDYWHSGEGARDIGSMGGSMASFAIPQAGAVKALSMLGNAGKIAQMGNVAKFALGSVVPSVTEAMTEGGGVYNNLTDKGVDAETAKKAGMADFWNNLPLLVTTGTFEGSMIAKAFAPESGKVLSKLASRSIAGAETLASAGSEGYQELMQTRYQNSAEAGNYGLGDVDYTPIAQNNDESRSAYLGALMGGGMVAGSKAGGKVADYVLDGRNAPVAEATPATTETTPETAPIVDNEAPYPTPELSPAKAMLGQIELTGATNVPVGLKMALENETTNPKVIAKVQELIDSHVASQDQFKGAQEQANEALNFGSINPDQHNQVLQEANAVKEATQIAPLASSLQAGEELNSNPIVTPEQASLSSEQSDYANNVVESIKSANKHKRINVDNINPHIVASTIASNSLFTNPNHVKLATEQVMNGIAPITKNSEINKSFSQSPISETSSKVDNTPKADVENHIHSLNELLGNKKKVEFFDSNDSNSHINGFYNKETGTIHLNRKSNKSLHWVFGHEFGHHLEQTSPVLAKRIKDTLVSGLKKNGNLDKLTSEYSKNLQLDKDGIAPNGKKYSPEDIHAEIASDLIGDRMAEGKFLNSFKDENHGFVQAIKSALIKFVEKIKKAFKIENHKDWSNDYIESFKHGLSGMDDVIDNVLNVRVSDKLHNDMIERRKNGEELPASNKSNLIEDSHYPNAKIKEGIEKSKNHPEKKVNNQLDNANLDHFFNKADDKRNEAQYVDNNPSRQVDKPEAMKSYDKEGDFERVRYGKPSDTSFETSSLKIRMEDGRSIEDAFYNLGDISKVDSHDAFTNLLRKWASKNPKLLEKIRLDSEGRTLSDLHANPEINRAKALAEILNETNPTAYPLGEHRISVNDGKMGVDDTKYKKFLSNKYGMVDLAQILANGSEENKKFARYSIFNTTLPYALQRLEKLSFKGKDELDFYKSDIKVVLMKVLGFSNGNYSLTDPFYDGKLPILDIVNKDGFKTRVASIKDGKQTSQVKSLNVTNSPEIDFLKGVKPFSFTTGYKIPYDALVRLENKNTREKLNLSDKVVLNPLSSETTKSLKDQVSIEGNKALKDWIDTTLNQRMDKLTLEHGKSKDVSKLATGYNTKMFNDALNDLIANGLESVADREGVKFSAEDKTLDPSEYNNYLASKYLAKLDIRDNMESAHKKFLITEIEKRLGEINSPAYTNRFNEIKSQDPSVNTLENVLSKINPKFDIIKETKLFKENKQHSIYGHYLEIANAIESKKDNRNTFYDENNSSEDDRLVNKNSDDYTDLSSEELQNQEGDISNEAFDDYKTQSLNKNAFDFLKSSLNDNLFETVKEIFNPDNHENVKKVLDLYIQTQKNLDELTSSEEFSHEDMKKEDAMISKLENYAKFIARRIGKTTYEVSQSLAKSIPMLKEHFSKNMYDENKVWDNMKNFTLKNINDHAPKIDVKGGKTYKDLGVNVDTTVHPSTINPNDDIRVKDPTKNLDNVQFSTSKQTFKDRGIVKFLSELFKKNTDGKPYTIDILSKYLRSPSKIAEFLPETFGKIYHWANDSFAIENDKKKAYFERLNPIFDSLTKEEQKVLDQVVLNADGKGRDLTSAEIRSLGGNENVIKAMIKLRDHLDEIHKELNITSKAFKGYGINYIHGYFPHMFENWTLQYTLPNGKTFRQTYATRNEALVKLNEAQNAGMKDLSVSFNTQEFHSKPNFSNNRIKDLNDSEQKDLNQTFTLSGDDLEALRPSIKDLIAKPEDLPSAHRFLGNLLERKGMKGYSLNVRHAINQYTNRSARFIALEPFKSKTTAHFGNIYGNFDLDYDDNPEARYAKNFIKDFNGDPVQMDKAIDNIIAGVPVLKDYMGKHFGSRYSVAIANGVTAPTTILTLGLYNISTALIQLSQLMNINAVLGVEHTLNGVKRLHNMSAEDLAVIKASGIEQNANMSNSSGYATGSGSFSYDKRIRGLADKSMKLFNMGDMATRKVAVLGAYHKAIGEGKTKSEAIRIAQQTNVHTNFEYGVHDSPQMFRSMGALGQVLLQFKKFSVKEAEFMYDLLKSDDKKAKIRFVASTVMMAGMMGIPFEELFGDTLKFLTGGKDVNLELRNYANTHGKSGVEKAFYNQLIYGAGSHLGIDVSRRVGVSDVVPDQFKDFAPAVQKPIIMLQQLFKKGLTSAEFAGSISPVLGNLKSAYDGKPKGDLKVSYTPYERFARAVGFVPLSEAIERDKAFYKTYSQKENMNNKTNKKKHT